MNKWLFRPCIIAIVVVNGCTHNNTVVDANVFHGETEGTTRLSMERMSAGPTAQLTYIPTLIAFNRIDAFKCGNARLLLCGHVEVDIINYACLGRVVNGMSKESVMDYANSLPKYDCETAKWQAIGR